jgi:hypothetical protein
VGLGLQGFRGFTGFRKRANCCACCCWSVGASRAGLLLAAFALCVTVPSRAADACFTHMPRPVCLFVYCCRAHRGLRHYWGLRVKGQHTKTTGRRGKTVGVAKKK